MAKVERFIYLGAWKHFYIKKEHIEGLTPEDNIYFKIKDTLFCIPVWNLLYKLRNNKTWIRDGKYADARGGKIPNWLIRFTIKEFPW